MTAWPLRGVETRPLVGVEGGVFPALGKSVAVEAGSLVKPTLWTRAHIRIAWATPIRPLRSGSARHLAGFSSGRSWRRPGPSCGQGRIYRSAGLRPPNRCARRRLDLPASGGAAGPKSIIVDNGAVTPRLGCAPPTPAPGPRPDPSQGRCP